MITNYSSLQSEIIDYLHRTDLGPKIPMFIQMAESKLANNIRSRKLEQSVDLVTVIGQDYISLPEDFGSIKSMNLQGAIDNALTLVPVGTFLKYGQFNHIGTPTNFCIEGDKIKLTPVPDSEYTITLVYLQRLVSLSTVNPTNWVLDRYPYVYFYGALLAGSVYINDPEQAQFFQQSYDDAIQDIWDNSNSESMSGSPMRATSDYVVDYVI